VAGLLVASAYCQAGNLQRFIMRYIDQRWALVQASAGWRVLQQYEPRFVFAVNTLLRPIVDTVPVMRRFVD